MRERGRGVDTVYLLQDTVDTTYDIRDTYACGTAGCVITPINRYIRMSYVKLDLLRLV